jgi:putative colanic acid biosynthesis acetyltransferase WcaB
MFKFVCQDWTANQDNSKGRFVLLLYRATVLGLRLPFPLRFLGRIWAALYRIFVGWIMGIELPLTGDIGPELKIFHGQCLVIHEKVKIGRGVVLRHGTTIGGVVNADGNEDVPRIGNFVDIGANVVIVGNIVVGDYAVIGAGAVIVKDVPAYSVAVGNPARLFDRTTPVSK